MAFYAGLNKSFINVVRGCTFSVKKRWNKPGEITGEEEAKRKTEMEECIQMETEQSSSDARVVRAESGPFLYNPSYLLHKDFQYGWVTAHCLFVPWCLSRERLFGSYAQGIYESEYALLINKTHHHAPRTLHWNSV
jgi:hypothetical protein